MLGGGTQTVVRLDVGRVQHALPARETCVWAES